MKSPLPRRLYSGGMYLAAPFLVGRLFLKSREHPGYRAYLGERFGWVQPLPTGNRRVHFHCVSVGESLAALPLIQALADKYPALAISVSVTTPTGRDQLCNSLPDRIEILWLPFDLPDAVSRFFDRIKPDLVVLVETELWPNLIHQSHHRQIPLMVVNARMSSRSARGYRRLARLTESMLAEVSLVLAQFPSDASRFVDLGCSPSRVQVVGSMKFDSQLKPEQRLLRDQAVKAWGLEDKPVWIAASTHEGEEEQILEMHRQLLAQLPEARLILVPRHPHRCDEVENLLRENQFSFRRRSAIDSALEESVLLVDTIGELQWLYGLAQVALVGGSLVPHGGHNPIEPALWQIPALVGPYTHNFSDITSQMLQAGALVQGEQQVLGKELVRWLQDSDSAGEAGQSGTAVLQNNRGALLRQLDAIESLLGVE